MDDDGIFTCVQPVRFKISTLMVAARFPTGDEMRNMNGMKKGGRS